MKYSKWSIYFFITVFYVSFTSMNVSFAGESAFKDDTNAKIAKIKAKQKRMKRAMRAKGLDPDSGNSGKCGSVEIGNVSNERGARGPKDVTVIVTGDVINTDNDCR